MKRWIPTREKIVASRWLGPLAPRLSDDRLWQLDRAGVARAVAIGLFFGLALPFGQIAFAVTAAIWLRAHVTIAATATLVTNPLTFAPIYCLAYRIGLPLSEQSGAATWLHSAPDSVPQAASPATGWSSVAWDALNEFGAPLMIGLAVLSVSVAVAGYAIVWLLWRPPATGS